MMNLGWQMRWSFLSLVVLIASLVAGAVHADARTDELAGEAAFARGDFPEAARLLRKAADQGNAEAQYNLGAMYRAGQGVPQGNAEAVRWFRKAADQGDAKAQYNLGVMYHDGQGVPQDLVRALMWVSLSTANLQGEERYQAERNRAFMASKMTPAQVTEAQKLALEWKPKPDSR